jgi:hypothetical protein
MSSEERRQAAITAVIIVVAFAIFIAVLAERQNEQASAIADLIDAHLELVGRVNRLELRVLGLVKSLNSQAIEMLAGQKRR